MTNKLIVPFILALFLSPLAHAQVCGEMFRATPELESVLRRPFVGFFGGYGDMNTPAPNQTRLLRAVEADVLGFKRGVRGWPARAKYSMKRTFHIIGAGQGRNDLAKIEFHRRRYERELENIGLPVGRDIRTRLRENAPYLSMAFSAAANATANFIAYKYFDTAGFIVHVPMTKFFNERTLPNDVITELIEARSEDEVPRTHAYVSAHIRFGVDEIVAAGRRMFNYGILAVLLVTHGDLIYDPSGASIRAFDTTTSMVHEASRQTNFETLHILEEKRARFLAAGQMDKVAQADALIIEAGNQKDTP